MYGDRTAEHPYRWEGGGGIERARGKGEHTSRIRWTSFINSKEQCHDGREVGHVERAAPTDCVTVSGGYAGVLNSEAQQ